MNVDSAPTPQGGVVAVARCLAPEIPAIQIAPGRVIATAENGTCGAARTIEESAASESQLAGALRSVAAKVPSTYGLVIHYSGYGFDRHGCPSWLLRELESFVREQPYRFRLAIFHEIYASGLPWQRPFWLAPLQRRLARRLVRISDAAVTSLTRYRARLKALDPTIDPIVLPVFSTAGELSGDFTDGEREPVVVVFGREATRAPTYVRYSRSLRLACQQIGARCIWDIGPGGDSFPLRLGEVEVRRLGILSERELSQRLRRAMAGFISYPPPYLPKSTVFAAYAAHGLIPACAWKTHRVSASLAAGREYWDPESGMDSSEWAAITRRAHRWYQGHRFEAHVRQYRAVLEKPVDRGRRNRKPRSFFP